jgi:hypothetical protein
MATTPTTNPAQAPTGSVNLGNVGTSTSTNPTSSTSDLGLEVQGIGALLGLPWGQVSVATGVTGLRTLASEAAAGNSEAKQNLENLQTTLFDLGFYKGQTATKPKLGVLTGNSDLNAFKTMLEGAASSGMNVNDYLNSLAASGGQPGSGTTIVAPAKVEQTVYSAADIQATADATAKSLIGRVLTGSEMNGVLNILNSASGSKASADAAAALAQTESDVTTEQAIYGTANAPTPGAGGGGKASAQQVYDEVLADGGSATQANVAAALVSGIESDGDPTELAGGKGPAQGLFQFEPGTWSSAVASAGGAKSGLPGTVGAATWQQQVQAFVAYTKGNNFGAWGPDLVANSGDPNSSSNPAYGYAGAPQPGSKVGNFITANGANLQQNSGAAAGTTNSPPSSPTIAAVGEGGTQGQNTVVYQAPVITDVPAVPDPAEAATNYIETQLSPQYQANNLLDIFQMIEGKLGTQPAAGLNPHVRTSPIAMK